MIAEELLVAAYLIPLMHGWHHHVQEKVSKKQLQILAVLERHPYVQPFAAVVLEKSGITKYIPGRIISIDSSYHHLGKIKNHIGNSGYKILNEEYSEHVIIMVLIPEKEMGSFIEKVADLTNADAIVTRKDDTPAETRVARSLVTNLLSPLKITRARP